jgi:peptidoglycan/LPS O-acetylase OafA/YrhL
VGSAATIQKSGTPPSTALQSHLPSLDGMRAISILLVLVLHSRTTFFQPGDAADAAIDYFKYVGRLGVWIFFVISGLLITWLMIREREATGAFSLRSFYIRRFIRILPVFWLLIIVVSALKVSHVISIGGLDIVRALTFTHDYPPSLSHPGNYAWWLGHTWSLSLEEQFYLLWPALFLLVPRRWIPRLAVTLAFSGPILRILLYHFLFPSMRNWDYYGFESHFDLLMAGCASAFLLDSPVWRSRIRRIPVWPTLAVASAFLLIVVPPISTHLPPHSRPLAIVNIVTPTFDGVMIALILLVLTAGEQGLVIRMLNSRIATHVGKLSYSLYIWQQLLLPPSSAFSALPLLWRLPAVYLAGLCSFNLVERPLLKLRSRFRRGVSV